MKKYLSSIVVLTSSIMLGACAIDKPVIYGKINNNAYIIGQVCIKDKKAEVENKIRYSILFSKNNFIRAFEPEPIKINDSIFYDLPIGEKRNLVAFLLPYEYGQVQNFGYGWDLKKSTSVSSRKWTEWKEPEFTVQDISDTNFKVDDGFIGKKNKDDSTDSPYLVRFKSMDVEDYITNRLNKWKNDPVPACVVLEKK